MSAAISAAFSVRTVVPGYTGPVLTARRASDNVRADFFSVFISATSFWDLQTASGTTFASWVGASTGFAAVLYDQTASGRHAQGNSLAVQPTIVLGTTLPSPLQSYVLGFLGQTRVLDFSPLTASTAWVVFSSASCGADSTKISTVISHMTVDISLRVYGIGGSAYNGGDWLNGATGVYTNGVPGNTLARPL